LDEDTAPEDLFWTLAFKDRDSIIGSIIVQLNHTDSNKTKMLYCTKGSVCKEVIIDSKFDKVLEVKTLDRKSEDRKEKESRILFDNSMVGKVDNLQK